MISVPNRSLFLKRRTECACMYCKHVNVCMNVGANVGLCVYIERERDRERERERERERDIYIYIYVYIWYPRKDLCILSVFSSFP